MKSAKLIRCSASVEKDLWQGCLMQHIRDMLLAANTPKTTKLQKEAEEFLLNNEIEFRAICILAGYNPDRVRLSLKALYKYSKAA